MSDPTCGTCRYWARGPELPDGTESKHGACRRRAATANEQPRTSAAYWCGEHPAIVVWLVQEKRSAWLEFRPPLEWTL